MNKGSSITINGAEIVTGASEPTYVTSSIYNQATSINADKDNASGDYTVEFAERYQTDLRLTLTPMTLPSRSHLELEGRRDRHLCGLHQHGRRVHHLRHRQRDV